MVDFFVQNAGSLFILHPLTNEAEDWVARHIPTDAMTWGDGIVIEHRYIGNIIAGALAAGLVVE